MEELISVIVPVYNVEKYLNKCIDSIINQTYKNLEIILVDDGSTDNSGKICDEYAKKDNRIIVIHKENGGLSNARNAGIKNSQGLYTSFVDSDDYILPNMIDRLYKIMIQNQADISICNFTRSKEEMKEETTKKICIEKYSQEDYLKKYFKIKYQGCEYYAWNKLYKRELITPDQYPQGLTSEDVLGTYKAILKAKKIVKTNEVLYVYRINEESITGTFTQRDFDLLEIWNLVEKYSKENAPQYLEYAKINRKRINFTLLYRMAKKYSNKELRENEMAKKLLNDLKQDEKYLLKAPIDFKRKVIIFLFCRRCFFVAKFI